MFRRKTLREQKERDKKVGPERIKTDLLDSEAQYRKGRTLMDSGEFQEAIQYIEFASDCDPQNGLYRAELSYCRYVNSPSSAEQCLDDLREACRIDPRCGLAVFYTGEILRDLQRYGDAEPLLREAIKMMAPDRRPIDALKALSEQRKDKRRGG